MGQIMGEDRAAPRVGEFPHMIFSCDLHMYVRKLPGLEKEPLELNRQNHPWSLHTWGIICVSTN